MQPPSELTSLVDERARELEASNEALRQSEQRLATELDAAERLQHVATQLITAEGTNALFEQIVDAAAAILHSDFASIQILCPERGTNGELRLLGHRGFSAEAAKWWEFVHTEMRSTCAEALRTGRSVVASDVRKCAFMSGSRDLDQCLGAGIIAVQSTPLVSRSGTLLGVVSTHWREPHELSVSELRALDILARLAADLIERSRAEDSLKAALEHLQYAAENMTCGVARASKDRRYLWVNRGYAAWLGLPPEEVAGRPILDLIGQPCYDEIRPHIEKALAGEREEFEADMNYRGSNRHVHKSYMPTRDVDQNVDGWLAVITDVTGTRRVQAESFAKQKLESIGMLASGIAHDFNNLLGGVLAQTELACAQLAAGVNPNQELDAIRSVALRGSEIVRELLIYAGKESGPVRVVDVAGIVEEMLPLLKVSVSKHAALEIALGKDLPGVRANDAQLRQVLLNLITNASDAIGDRDGTIRVTTELLRVDNNKAMTGGVAEGDYLGLTVADTGCGMSKETLAKVLEPFFSTKSTGRGIGLAVVDGIVRSLGGAIRVASEPNKGAAFQIFLPISGAVTGVKPDPISLAEETECPPQEGIVLFADDEEALRRAVGKMLRKSGFVVLEAADGDAAANLLRENGARIDVILLDLNMPGAPTNEVIAKAAEARPDIKVIVTSAFNEEMARSWVNTTQIAGFIRKPFQFGDLLKMLRGNTPRAAVSPLTRSAK